MVQDDMLNANLLSSLLLLLLLLCTLKNANLQYF